MLARRLKVLTDYLGRAVRLTDERMRHVLEHPEMAGMDEPIERTVAQPERVVRSRSDQMVELCHRTQTTEKFGEKWLCVVIKYTDDPFVVTAFLTNKPKSGVVIWPRP